MKSDPPIFVYKITTDNGGAPCVQGGLLSLAICKPTIRRKANENERRDWIIGLGGKALGEGIIYIARVTDTVGLKYYTERRYARRPDCIYHFREGELIRKKTAAYHQDPGNKAKDVGTAPGYRNARVLLSSDFRYFGNSSDGSWSRTHPSITVQFSSAFSATRVFSLRGSASPTCARRASSSRATSLAVASGVTKAMTEL